MISETQVKRNSFYIYEALPYILCNLITYNYEILLAINNNYLRGLKIIEKFVYNINV